MAGADVYCRNCGTRMGANSELCPDCGTQQTRAEPPSSRGKSKSPGLAALLSFLITGTGQIYLGRVGRGLAFLFGGIALSIFLGAIDPALSLLALLVALVSIGDAYALGKRINRTS